MANSLRFLREQARLSLEEAARLLGVSGLALTIYEGQIPAIPDDLLERAWRLYEANNRRTPEPEPPDDDCYVPGVDDDGPPPSGL